MVTVYRSDCGGGEIIEKERNISRRFHMSGELQAFQQPHAQDLCIIRWLSVYGGECVFSGLAVSIDAL